jgi:hypothetical protein
MLVDLIPLTLNHGVYLTRAIAAADKVETIG